MKENEDDSEPLFAGKQVPRKRHLTWRKKPAWEFLRLTGKYLWVLFSYLLSSFQSLSLTFSDWEFSTVQ